MSDLFGIDSAIGWAHFRLRNGWKTPLLGAAAYAVLLAVIVTVSIQADPRHSTRTYSNFRIFILVLQSANLLLLATSRINNAVRTDITLRLVESHRLMPISPILAVIGYLWGPNLLPLCLAVVGFIAGAFVTEGAGLDLFTWTIANAVLFSFALFCWMVVALAASQSRAAGLLVFITLALLTVAAGPMLVVAPPAVLLNGPMVGSTIYDANFDPLHRSQLLLASTATQLALGLPLLIGVARKYRWPAQPALATLPALAILAVWVAASMFAIAHVEDLRPRFWRLPGNAVLSASLLTSMLIAVLPISNTVRSATAHRAAPMIALACAAIISVLFCMADLPGNKFFRQVGLAAVVLCSYCLGISFLLRLLRGMKFMGSITIIWLLLTWLGPVALDFLIYVGTDTNHEYDPTVIMGFSPVGSLVRLFRDRGFDPQAGIIFQVVLSAAIVVLSLLRGRSKINGELR